MTKTNKLTNIASADDSRWLSRALLLAEKGRYTARPNPCVGCVLVKDGRLLAEGWHYRAGEAHAEIHALRQAGDAARGATAYVTLEPCDHRGKTGPCTEALITAGISRVVYSMQDPNPLVSGKGLATLRRAGVVVDGPYLSQQAAALNVGFIRRMQAGLPWVRCKLAASLDGRTAMASGESQWITGAAARADVQRLRASSGVIMTGIGSILQDNSRLNIREDELDLPNKTDVLQCPPLRVVLDSQLQIPLRAAVLQGHGATVVFVTEATFAQQSAKCEEINRHYGDRIKIVGVATEVSRRLSLIAVLQYLAAQHQINEVLLEAGPILAGAFLQQGLIDELIIYQAPVLLGSDARPLFDLPLQQMSDKWSLDLIDQRQLGKDCRITARPVQRQH